MTQMNALCPVCGDPGMFSLVYALAPPTFRHFAELGQVDFPCGHILVVVEEKEDPPETIE